MKIFVALTQAATGQGGLLSSLSMLVLPIGMIALLYFLMIRPQRKQEKKQREERGKLVVGDSVITIGGVVGKVVNIKDDEITIATSVAQTLMTFRRDAINSVLKPVSDTKRVEPSKAGAAGDSKKSGGLFGRKKNEDSDMK